MSLWVFCRLEILHYKSIPFRGWVGERAWRTQDASYRRRSTGGGDGIDGRSLENQASTGRIWFDWKVRLRRWKPDSPSHSGFDGPKSGPPDQSGIDGRGQVWPGPSNHSVTVKGRLSTISQVSICDLKRRGKSVTACYLQRGGPACPRNFPGASAACIR